MPLRDWIEAAIWRAANGGYERWRDVQPKIEALRRWRDRTEQRR
jgi:hypothetical protein